MKNLYQKLHKSSNIMSKNIILYYLYNKLNNFKISKTQLLRDLPMSIQIRKLYKLSRNISSVNKRSTSCILLGYMSLITKRYNSAFKHFNNALELSDYADDNNKNFYDSQTLVAMCYYYGYGTTTNIKKALDILHTLDSF